MSLTYTNVPVSVETIQDYVERVLMQFGYYDIAKTLSYIVNNVKVRVLSKNVLII
ncbi:hypothetical protein [Bacteroides thetaiotaomicron]|uniref:hypothetical protein n=1 Tax=Bacteroides thetaiotaomicron TaxID=818 RepID=UPI0021640903|nr:hypothetical protein NXV61_18900 [Bacteroides thetaiotaomicron]